MAAHIDDFPHRGEHLATDDKQADLTIALIATFVIFTSLLMLVLVLLRA